MSASLLDELRAVNAEFPWFFATVVFVFGAVVGSFLNVCIYRIPGGRSIIRPGSTCACGKRIAWHDNIPIFSWLILRGRARCCGQKFSVRYPAIELLTAGLFLACWLQHPPAKAAAGMLLTAMLICASFIDLDHMEIPDRFSLGAAALGVIYSSIFPELHGFASDNSYVDRARAVVESLHGLFIGAGVVVMIGLGAEAVLKKEAMGLGDVKLVAAIGAFFGWQGAVFCIFSGALLGTLGLGVVMIVQRIRRKPAIDDEVAEPSGIGFGQYVPFGPMLAAGSLLYFLWLHPIVDHYFVDVARLLSGSY